ncbi:zinc finger HIT domain-containing protein 2 [Erpetoichthys calabaricus]|uniref:Zinc finger, HIT-type containing 2 n=1 Tax=Erpetoichthys calabaricus TaxID=27687 RepID=A0A8C4S040_ERPCA|nr:zinc finger HIT domain-containing protein 2 [Erpetoichthys calabaricus]XP_028660144.1 zinc finger HIT domain-containing protein 2 [Erpetoichthys calabaricus]
MAEDQADHLAGASTTLDGVPGLKDILIPSRVQSTDQEFLITPSNEADTSSLCGLCISNPGHYTCPRCNIRFCSLQCYRGDNHGACSEEFYKESIFEHLKLEQASEEGKRRMEEILLRTHQMENSEELEQFEDGLETEGLSERLAGLDLDNVSEDEIWDHLSEGDKRKFNDLLSNGKIGIMVKQWVPWWEKHETRLVEEVEVNMEAEDIKLIGLSKNEACLSKQNEKSEPEITEMTANLTNSKKTSIPPIYTNIPPLNALNRSPSHLVRYNLVNALYSYTFCLQLYNGDISEDFIKLEFTQALLNISQALGSARVFGSVEEALHAGVDSVRTGPLYDKDDPLAALRAVLAVAHVLVGESRSQVSRYTLASLSQMRKVLGYVRKTDPQLSEEEKKKYFRTQKKIEFLMAWVCDNENLLITLALKVQSKYKTFMHEQIEIKAGELKLEKIQGQRTLSNKAVLIEELN